MKNSVDDVIEKIRKLTPAEMNKLTKEVLPVHIEQKSGVILQIDYCPDCGGQYEPMVYGAVA